MEPSHTVYDSHEETKQVSGLQDKELSEIQYWINQGGRERERQTDR